MEKIKKAKFICTVLAFYALNLIASPSTVNILVYSSFTGKGSIGEWIQNNSAQACGQCKIHFKSTQHNAGLWGHLRSLKKRESLKTYDLVIGLNSDEKLAALNEGIILKSALFDYSPMAILADTKQLPVSSFPKTWKDLIRDRQKNLIIQDPRISSPGLILLRLAFQSKVMNLSQLKELTQQVFPSWSSSYEAFLNGSSPLIWTYLTSEAYHRCHEKDPKQATRYIAVPLKEGYPILEEHVGILNNRRQNPATEAVFEFLKSKIVQEQIPLKNSMLPGVRGTQIPNCFEKMSSVKTFSLEPILDDKKLIEWKDQWSL